MGTQNDEFLELLRATFQVEATEHLQAIAAGLLELEQAGDAETRRRIVETVFRAAHSLKGAARAVDSSEVESICATLEDSFAVWKRDGRAPAPSVLDTLHDSVDAISALLAAPAASCASGAARLITAAPRLPSVPPAQPPDIFAAARTPGQGSRPGAGGATAAVPATTAASVPDRERAAAAVPGATTIVPPIPGSAAAADTVRITIAKLDARLLQAEEMLAVKLTTSQRADDLLQLGHSFDAWKKACATVEPKARALRQAVERPGSGGVADAPGISAMLEFFERNLDQLKALESRVAALARTAEQDRYIVGRLVDDLLADSKKLLLFPFGTFAGAFAKPVRDLCRDQGKEAELRIEGEDIEVDRRILEEMKDPLLHLLRNGIDHGIESPDERAARGKPRRAAITLAAARIDGSKVQLLLSDDGRGIETGKVKASAVRQGLVSADVAGRLDETEGLALIFQSGMSTSPIITELSGRGIGLAIVREKARKLGGDVTVESRPGQGTTFRIVVPATRATFRGVLVEAGGQQLLVPTAQVERVGRVVADDIQTVEGRETISQEGRAVPLVHLADALELPPGERDAAAAGVTVIVLGQGNQRIAFVVDAVLDEQEVLVKPLPKPLSRVRNVAAATVLGSGRIAPILHVADLLKSARRLSGMPARAAAAKPAEAKAVLVAEDSITSRMLIKGILESAGYRVKTAVDGMEALALLRAEDFDLVVSDVEMPRLNGFDLTAQIRADKAFAELPVILVTALETREHRERGIDAGANAYIVKSSFDQSNLLEAVQRLI